MSLQNEKCDDSRCNAVATNFFVHPEGAAFTFCSRHTSEKHQRIIEHCNKAPLIFSLEEARTSDPKFIENKVISTAKSEETMGRVPCIDCKVGIDGEYVYRDTHSIRMLKAHGMDSGPEPVCEKCKVKREKARIVKEALGDSVSLPDPDKFLQDRINRVINRTTCASLTTLFTSCIAIASISYIFDNWHLLWINVAGIVVTAIVAVNCDQMLDNGIRHIGTYGKKRRLDIQREYLENWFWSRGIPVPEPWLSEYWSNK